MICSDLDRPRATEKLYDVSTPSRAHLAFFLTPSFLLSSPRYAVIRFNQYFKVKPQVSALEMPK